MTRRKLVSIASVVSLASGAVLITTPAQASSETFECRASVRAYCDWVASNFCAGSAICTYNTSTCEILNSQCG